MTDQELLRSFADQADARSLDVFIERHQGSILRFATRFLGDRDTAHDVVQETFLQVAERPRRLLEVDSCHNWLLRVARNVGIDFLRRKGTRTRHADRVARHAAAKRETSAVRERPADAAERRETREIILAEIAMLPTRRRELVYLKVVEEKSYREIAAITGMTPTNVGYQLHQAMKTLSGRLQRQREELL